MNCENARLLAGLYDDDELGAESARELKEHLNVCADCANVLAEREKIVSRLPGLPELPQSYWDSYKRTIMERIAKPQPMILRPQWRWATALALCFFVTGGVFLYKVREYQKMNAVYTEMEILENLEVLSHEDFNKWVSP